jgi:hypothetical protein
VNLVSAIALALAVAAAGDDHVVSGARLFRDGRYAEALVEFQVARRLGAPDAAAYAAASLVKLGHPEEALEAFVAAGPAGGDALLDYYRALAYHGARLYAGADAILAGIGERAGPKLAGQASRIRADLAPRLAAPPDPATLAWYRRRCEELRRAGRTALAELFCEEAAARERRAAAAGGGRARAAPVEGTGARP